MKRLISRLQKDLAKLHTTIQKEGNDLLDRVRNVDLKDNLEHKRRDFEKLIESKFRELEPMYHGFLDELRRSAKKTGLDIDRLEKELRKTAASAKEKLGKKTSSKKKASKGAAKTTAKKAAAKPSAKTKASSTAKTTTKTTSKKAAGGGRKTTSKASASGTSKKKTTRKKSTTA